MESEKYWETNNNNNDYNTKIPNFALTINK